MPKRKTKNKMEPSKKSHRIETQQVSPTAVNIKKEEVYRKDLTEFVLGLIQGEKYKKNAIKKLARDLEEAGTIETHKISTRIRHDLGVVQREKGLDKPLIHPDYVIQVLEDKYKQKSGPKGQKRKKDREISISSTKQVTTSTTQTTTESGQSQMPGPAQSTEQPRRSPQTVKQQVDFGEWITNLYIDLGRLAQQITGYTEDEIRKVEDIFELVSLTRTYRFDVTKKLDIVDLRTVHGDVRRDIILLDDFLKAVENELDSRKKKEGLISE